MVLRERGEGLFNGTANCNLRIRSRDFDRCGILHYLSVLPVFLAWRRGGGMDIRHGCGFLLQRSPLFVNGMIAIYVGRSFLK